ncbi:hypothetical protein EVAR_5294_1 [Eumeta japonica]|uniref:Uncharacterized protein n=1 Tax=Eumeta variegata TaxID=151549 RepID=A0A4C1TN63_EUMVA|nr:hypothetical protein EVAR_5294_1 [Eumeta japonica]
MHGRFHPVYYLSDYGVTRVDIECSPSTFILIVLMVNANLPFLILKPAAGVRHEKFSGAGACGLSRPTRRALRARLNIKRKIRPPGALIARDRWPKGRIFRYETAGAHAVLE